MPAQAHTYVVNVNREGKWWMVSIPELDGLTQARNEDEVEAMARDVIAVTLDVQPDSFALSVRML
jgi:predicted RNase H-like HicB family nuclease